MAAPAAAAPPAAAAAAAAAEPKEQGQAAITLSHRHVFGLKADVRSNVHYAEETQIIFPAGSNIVIWHADQKQQKFFQGNPGAEGITCLAVNANQRYLAVAERHAACAIVSIFDICTTKKRRSIACQDCDAPEFVSVAFSSDNKYLLTQTGSSPSNKHNWTLMYWLWDKMRLVASAKVSNAQNAPIRECSFNPMDSSVVTVVGDGIFKFFQMKEGSLKQMPVQAPKLANFLCHAWLTDDKLLVCAESGELMLYDNSGELVSSKLQCSPGEPRSATCTLSFSKGFVTGGDDGYIRVFEKSDDPKELYRRTKNIQLDAGLGNCVRSLALSPTEEVLAVTTSTAQLCQLSLLGQDLLKAEEAPVFEPVLTPFHTGAILGMDVCTRKPLVVTCGMDKSVRVWNYLEKTCELCKFFNEEAYSVAFHPSGFHLIIGFSDKLRLMNLLMEDMRTYRDISIKGCRECRFSNGGQYFAAVSVNTIQVYKTYTCESIANLRGHNSKVRSIAWTVDDSMLVSTGMDGAVYEYNVLAEGRRVGHDFVMKTTSFSCVIVYTDPLTGANTMYVVGNDKMLREVHGGLEHLSIPAGNTLGQIVLSNSAKTLFAVVAEPDAPAPVRCYKFPLDETAQPIEIPAHSAPATRIRITYDDFYLFTCSDDGCLYIFDIRKKDRVNAKRDKENQLPPADEILVTRTFLDEKQQQLVELERQVEELSNQMEFQVRHRESYHKEETVELEEKYTQEIDQEHMKFDLLREEKNDMEMEYEENIRRRTELHAKQTQDLEGNFQKKMMMEVGRYQKLAAERESVQKYWRSELQQLVDKHNRTVADMQREFAEKQAADKHRIQVIMEEKDLAERVHKETMRQLEEDTDCEIQDLKQEKEARLKAEKDEKVWLRGQSGIHRRHHEELRRDMTKKEEEFEFYVEQAKKKEDKIEVLNKDRDENLKSIRERDRTIGDKEQKIYELKKNNQELEKFKFVLDYRIKELKLQIDPKNDAIAEMKKKIQAMDADLEDYHKKKKQLSVNIEQLNLKQKSLQDEIVSQRKKMTDCQTIIKRFKNDLHECVQFIQDPKLLKESVTGLYKKYVPHGIKKQELDSDIQREYNRQRDYLEKSVESLKRKLLKDSDVHRTDNTRILQDNVALIREINDLRREIDFLRKERQQQRINVSKLKSSARPSPSQSLQNQDVYSREMDTNKQTIAELQKRIDDELRLRESLGSGGTGVVGASGYASY
eukprot:TRINITY_DN11755_c0_g1_i1.p1 TRINITY_DN11755_c0_g1~~TRINITY_DN11755_c0_g1_i1.p1  ORF type:complete len:1221 (-),score=291.71 TRINITY_DN11755_c0_g1_i1:257-3919(-)